MAIRAGLLQAVTALLYFGPLLAGLAGYGWAMLPPFVSLFAFWLVLLRPQDWPQTPGDWLRPRPLLAALSLILSQVLLVALLFAIGRGIGGVTGHLPLLHPLLPLGLSFLALPLSRLIWNAGRATASGLTLDQVLHPAPMPPRQVPHTPADEAILPLLALPADAPLTEVGPLLDDTLDEADGWDRLARLADALEAAPARHAALREAVLIWATEPELFAANATPTALRAAFRAAGRDPASLALLLPRVVALARAFPERHPQFPDRATLAALARPAVPPPLAADHAALMAALGHGAARGRARSPARIGDPRAT